MPYSDYGEDAILCAYRNHKKEVSKIKKKILIGIVIFFILMIVIGALSDKKDTTTQITVNNEAAAAPTDQNNVAKINEPVKVDDLVFTVTNVVKTTTLGNQYTKKTAQGEFNIVTIKIENTGKETKTIDSSLIKIIDDQGRTYDRSIEGQTAKGMSEGKVDMFLQQVQPGLNVTGDVVFDLPKDTTGLKLLVRSGIFGKEKEIDLNK